MRYKDPQRFHNRATAITSLSLHPAKRERQAICLQSWIDIGLDVITVNTAADMQTLEIPQGVQCVTNEQLTTIYDRPTQPIWHLLQAGISTGHPFLLINSDIEMCGHPSTIERAIDKVDSLTIGVRWNHNRGKTLAAREEWGLDAFVMTPDMAKTVPRLNFGIGKPAWDYWVPHHFRSLSYSFHWISEPFFFHELHPLGWSQREWFLGAAMLEETYGVDIFADAVAFRIGLSK